MLVTLAADYDLPGPRLCPVPRGGLLHPSPRPGLILTWALEPRQPRQLLVGTVAPPGSSITFSELCSNRAGPASCAARHPQGLCPSSD